MHLLLFGLAVWTLLPGCFPFGSSSSGTSSLLPSGDRAPDFSKLTPSCFTPVAPAPILSVGSLIPDAKWNDPHVLKIGGQFVMYASADLTFNQNVKIYRLVSQNGRDWALSPSAAVLEKSTDPAAWDRGSVETPAVVYFKGLYHLFYTGYTDQTDSTTYGIGHATSADGVNWTRISRILGPTNPKGAPDLNFMQYVVAEPAPVVFNGKLYLYFAAEGAHTSVSATLFTIGLITSEDGNIWRAPQEVLVPDQMLYPRSTWIGYSTPHAAVLNGQMHLFFDVAKVPFRQSRYHHAVSQDGVSGWVHDGAAIFDVSQIPWADDQINAPAVLLDGTTLYFWFAGQGNLVAFPNITMGIGLALCPL